MMLPFIPVIAASKLLADRVRECRAHCTRCGRPCPRDPKRCNVCEFQDVCGDCCAELHISRRVNVAGHDGRIDPHATVN
jgi:hypothetical protein